MYVCPSCRSYFKTGGADKKIKCPKCKEVLLLSLKITDEKWRLLDKEARQSRISRALAGEQLRDEAPKVKQGPVIPAVPVTPAAPPVSHTSFFTDQAAPSSAQGTLSSAPAAPSSQPVTDEKKSGDNDFLFKADAPDEAILEARRLLEEKDVQAEMPAPQVDFRKLMIVCMTAFVLLLIPSLWNLVFPIFTLRGEMDAISQAEPGDSIEYGKYDGGRTWRIIEAEDDRVLVISDRAVNKNFKDSKDNKAITAWLNSSFMNRTFNVYERARIIPAKEGDDKVFLIPGESPADGIYPAFWIRL